MALRTGNVFVTAVEFKSGCIMIKMSGFPPVEIMTTGAGSNLAGVELLVVSICVAIEATGGQTGELLLLQSVRIRLEMALFAGGFGVFSGKFEFGGVMVELNLVPGDNRMAALTALVLEELLPDIVAMNIFVAVDTFLLQILEYPILSLFMAGETGGCQMRPFQRENALIMLLQRVYRRLKTIQGMAILAVRFHSRLFELAFMIILMAIGTVRIIQVRRESGFMARLAFHRLMFANERISRFIVVECVQPGHLLK